MKNILIKTLLLGLLAAYFGSGQELALAQSNGTSTATIKKIGRNIATMNKGSADGVSVGQRFTVIRKARGGTVVVGTAAVRAVSQTRAGIRLVASEDGRSLKKGDRVILKNNEQLYASKDGLPANGNWEYQNGVDEFRHDLVNEDAEPINRKEFGLKAGLNLANLNGDYAFSTAQLSPSSTWGFSAGAFFTYRFSDVFAVQPEVLYTRKGADLREGLFSLKLEYIEFPLLLKFSLPLPQDALVIPNVFAGPTLAVNISSELSSETQPVNPNQESTETLDYGLVFGLGAKIPLLYGALTFDVRYTLGLKSIDESLNQLGAKNNVLSVLAGFSF